LDLIEDPGSRRQSSIVFCSRFMMINGSPVRLTINVGMPQCSPLQSGIMIETRRIVVPSRLLDTLRLIQVLGKRLDEV
jgi:hypothetical protein